MNFFKDLFNFKRTKMLDEAVFFHKPVTIGKSIVSFIVTLLIANLIVAVLQSIPLIIYMFSQPELLEDIASGSADALGSLVESMPSWLTALDLIFAGAFVAVAIYYCKKYENRSPFTMGFIKEGCAPEYLIGFLIGGGMIALSLLLNLAFGTVHVSFASFSPIIFLFLVGFVVKGFAESAFVYGYFTVSVARDYAPIVALVSGAVAYSLFSLSGAIVTIVSFINILLLGFLCGVYVFKRGSIIGSSALLAGWSFTQLSVFGPTTSASPLFLAEATGSSFVSGGMGGVGGGLPATLVLTVALFILLLTPQKRSLVSDFEASTSSL